MSNPSVPTARPRRVRLKPEVRSRLILEAALVEFGANGFSATRIEDIATRAGLAKTGVYAHFASKEAIFEALLDQVLLNARLEEDEIWQPDGTATVPDMVDAYLDRLYSMVQNPVFPELYRLLVAESGRAPDLVRRWHDQVVLKHRAAEQALIDACVRRGLLRDSPLTELFSLSVAPALLWMSSRLVLGNDSPYPLEQVRRIHRGMLLDQLQPRRGGPG